MTGGVHGAGRARHLNAVFSNAAPGKDAELNRWYDELHVHDCLREIEGYVSAQRFRLDAELGAGAACSWRYLALYELETDSLPAVYRSVEQFRRAGTYERAGDRIGPGHATWVFTPLEPDGAPELLPEVGDAHRLCLCLANARNGWFDDDVLRSGAPGLVAGGRYASSAEQRLGIEPRWPLLTVYRVEAGAVAEFLARRAFVALGDDHAAWVFAPVAPRVSEARRAAT